MNELEKIKASHAILSKAELIIKQNIVELTRKGKSIEYIKKRIEPMISKAVEALPSGVDKPSIYKGLKFSSSKWIKLFTVSNKKACKLANSLASRVIQTQQGKKIYLDVVRIAGGHRIATTDLDDETIQKVFKRYGAIEEANPVHGFTGGPEYKKELVKSIQELSRSNMVSIPDEKVKSYTSAFAKAERDLRHSTQMEMVTRAKKRGNPLQWISSHADCSKRCQRWQGKLVHMDLPAINAKKETGLKVDGYTVYSFKGITEVEDKHGYKNNIIVGFNCRHFLIPYQANSHPPAQYRDATIKVERNVSAKQRRMEKTIRSMKYEYELIKGLEPERAKELRKKWLAMRKEYVEYSRQHNAACYPWRLN